MSAAAPSGSPSGVDHMLVTRFNLPSEGVERLIRAEEGWLRERMRLFERYTVPSVRAQTRRPAWIVYVDPESPPWLLHRMAELEDEGLLVAPRRETVPASALVADAAALFPIRSAFLLTTNLDNDDGLAADFAERLCAVLPRDRRALYVVDGLILSSRGAYLRRDRRNAFCSVLEPWEGALTCWHDWHNRLERHMPVVEVPGPPAWLQVVHGRNVSNRVRGRLVDPHRYSARFPGLIDGLGSPPRRRLLVDSVLARPARSLRDGIRSTGRDVVVRMLGKSALDRLKVRIRGG